MRAQAPRAPMLSHRARWAIAIGGGLALGLLVVGAFAFDGMTTTTRVTISPITSPWCSAAIEQEGAPDAAWNATLVDEARFEIPIPDGIGPRYAYRIEVVGNASYAPISPDGSTGEFRTSASHCRDDGGQLRDTLGGEQVARGDGTIFVSFWNLTEP